MEQTIFEPRLKFFKFGLWSEKTLLVTVYLKYRAHLHAARASGSVYLQTISGKMEQYMLTELSLSSETVVQWTLSEKG